MREKLEVEKLTESSPLGAVRGEYQAVVLAIEEEASDTEGGAIGEILIEGVQEVFSELGGGNNKVREGAQEEGEEGAMGQGETSKGTVRGRGMRNQERKVTEQGPRARPCRKLLG